MSLLPSHCPNPSCRHSARRMRSCEPARPRAAAPNRGLVPPRARDSAPPRARDSALACAPAPARRPEAARAPEPSPFFWSKGSFQRRDRRRIRRFQCKGCGRHFSEQTLSPTWRRRRSDIDAPLLGLLRDGKSSRAAARLLGINRKTVERRARDPLFHGAPAPDKKLRDRSDRETGTSAAGPAVPDRPAGSHGRTAGPDASPPPPAAGGPG